MPLHYIALIVALLVAAALYLHRTNVVAKVKADSAYIESSSTEKLHELDEYVLDSLHKAEAEGKLVAGTVQSYVDAHVEQVKAVAEEIKSEL